MGQIVTALTSGIVGMLVGAFLDSLLLGRRLDRLEAHVHAEFEALRNHIDHLWDHVDVGSERVSEQISSLRE